MALSTPSRLLTTKDRGNVETSPNTRFIFTGGPGAGKTTLLSALKFRGFYCVPEVARALINTRLNSGLSPRPDPIEFANSIFNADAENYRSAPSSCDVIFFDRGVVDALCMLVVFQTDAA